MWFDDWGSILRILVVGTAAYAGLILLLRVSGKRTLSKMNAFDFVITITLGSVFASILVSDEVSFAEGMVSLALLVALQWVVSTIYVRSRWFEKVIKGDPALLYWKGEYLNDALKVARVTTEEIQAAMRASNVVAHKTSAAILETDGTISVITVEESEMPHIMKNVGRRE